jgi:hypothetical protein
MLQHACEIPSELLVLEPIFEADFQARPPSFQRSSGRSMSSGAAHIFRPSRRRRGSCRSRARVAERASGVGLMLLDTDNPNRSKPTLGLASLRRDGAPSPLDAALQRDPVGPNAPTQADAGVSRRREGDGLNDVGVIVPGAFHQEEICDHGADLPTGKSPKKPKRHPYASALAWPPRRELFPAVEIVGTVVPDEQITPQADAWRAMVGARFWCRRVAFEAAKDLPEDRREACERFCLRHRLSILTAFHKRLKRGDVVKVMRELYHAALRPDDRVSTRVNSST